jgi:uncharacterized SAM-binding protein YcdF (DUF218 family)
MSWFITNFISAFLLLPLNLLMMAGLGLLLWHKRPVIARSLLGISFALLWVLSTPYVATSLLNSLENKPYIIGTDKSQADAIVVLGGGTYFNAPEYDGDTVSKATLTRLRYAAKLHRETGKPILVTGGKPLGNSLSEGHQMQQVLEQEFNIPVRWVESESNNTYENARFSYETLNAAGIQHVYLVTHAWHMPRAAQTFRKAGFQVTPAATAYATHYKATLLSFLPNAGALRGSNIFLREVIGMLRYRLKS